MERSRVRQSSLLMEGEWRAGIIIYFSPVIFQMKEQRHKK